MDEKMPVDPIGGLLESAVSLHERFKSWVAAGFTTPQAMQLVCQFLVLGITRPSQE